MAPGTGIPKALLAATPVAAVALGTEISQPIGLGPQAQGVGLQLKGFEATQMVSLHGMSRHIGSSLHFF